MYPVPLLFSGPPATTLEASSGIDTDVPNASPVVLPLISEPSRAQAVPLSYSYTRTFP